MRSDIALILITLDHDEDKLHVTRGQVRAWVAELGLPSSALTRESTLQAFVTACETTTLKYTDDRGATRMLVSRRVKRSGEYITYDLLRDDSLKVAQIKYFSPRRTNKGTVRKSARIMSVTRKDLDAAEAGAAQQWLDTVGGDYGRRQDLAPWPSIRRIVRTSMEQCAVPVPRRQSTWFCYGDQLEANAGVAEFVARLKADGEFHLLPIRPDADRGLFAHAADVQLLERVDEAVDRIETWVAANPERRRNLRASISMWMKDQAEIAEQARDHEERLGCVLPLTRDGLALAEEMMRALTPNGTLPNVNPGDNLRG